MNETLARRALERADAMHSPRAVEVLRRAVLVVRERSGAAWESSEGSVVAIHVRALLDGTAMGLVRSFPAVHDAVVEAISAAAPEALGASVIDLSFSWGLKERGEPGYRDQLAERADPSSPVDVARALAAFLAASGDDRSAREVESAYVRIVDDHIEVLGVDPDRIQAALDALLGRTRMR